MDVTAWTWAGFGGFVVAMLALDLGVLHRRVRAVSLREALTWSAVWVGLALAFAGWIGVRGGSAPALEFLTGYLVEKSLSVDNVFVFAVLFAAFRVPKECEHKVLFWGVFGALLMRGVMIFAGVALLSRFHWLIYVFGALLILTGLKMLRPSLDPPDPTQHPLWRFCRRFVRTTSEYHGAAFVVRDSLGRLAATPLLMALIFVETTDLIFAVDSIPAILAISTDPFIVFTSNVFAMLGLRSLYFALSGLMDRFYYLKHSLAAILCFVGTKMLLSEAAPVPISVGLVVITSMLAAGIGASWWRTRRANGRRAEAGAEVGTADAAPVLEAVRTERPEPATVG